MTLLVSWVGVDTHGTSSAYIAADSRVSWGDKAVFEHGRKVFSFSNSPDILGYCGDVLFPSIVLGQIVEMADCGLLFNKQASCKERFEAIKEKLIQQFQQYPHMVKGVAGDDLQVVHVSRSLDDNKSFSCRLIKWNRQSGWAGERVDLPSQSGILRVLGSGAKEFNINLNRYQEGPNRGTSRCMFHCFCDTLFNIRDKFCGGAPQLVGLIRKPHSCGRTYGIIKDRVRYYLGAVVQKDVAHNEIEWKNPLFEACDGVSTVRKFDAQEQPDILKRY